jgi:nitrogen PTS system EIIA component
MPFDDILLPEAVIASLKVNSKKQALQEMSAFAAPLVALDEREVYDLIMQRERVGSTGIGEGVAIPHGKSAKLNHIQAVFARLERPVDFESIDNQPVDLIFMLLAPEDAGADHLKTLARVARVMREPSTLEKIRACRNRSALYSILNDNTAPQPA